MADHGHNVCAYKIIFEKNKGLGTNLICAEFQQGSGQASRFSSVVERRGVNPKVSGSNPLTDARLESI